MILLPIQKLVELLSLPGRGKGSWKFFNRLFSGYDARPSQLGSFYPTPNVGIGEYG